jgi:hypothetical protein
MAPKLVVDCANTDYLHQGELGNPWFVTACASLTKERTLFNTVSTLILNVLIYFLQ